MADNVFPVLLQSIGNSDLNGIRWALENSAVDINERNRRSYACLIGDTPLICALRHHMCYGPSPAQTELEILRVLLAHGADPNMPEVVDPRYKQDGKSPLHLACHFAVRILPRRAALLLEYGAKIDGRDARGLTPLMDAACDGQFEVARLLVRAGCDVTLRNNYGDDAESIARTKLASLKPEEDLALMSGPLAYAQIADMLAGVRAAGSWRRYATEPTVKLLLLRHLACSGRARAPPLYRSIYRRLFGSAPGTQILPDVVFGHVLRYWDGNHD